MSRQSFNNRFRRQAARFPPSADTVQIEKTGKCLLIKKRPLPQPDGCNKSLAHFIRYGQMPLLGIIQRHQSVCRSQTTLRCWLLPFIVKMIISCFCILSIFFRDIVLSLWIELPDIYPRKCDLFFTFRKHILLNFQKPGSAVRACGAFLFHRTNFLQKLQIVQ